MSDEQKDAREARKRRSYGYVIGVSPSRVGGENAIWVAQVEKLPGCIAQARTAEEAIEKVEKMLPAYLQRRRERDASIPEPDYDPERVNRILDHKDGGTTEEGTSLTVRSVSESTTAREVSGPTPAFA